MRLPGRFEWKVWVHAGRGRAGRGPVRLRALLHGAKVRRLLTGTRRADGGIFGACRRRISLLFRDRKDEFRRRAHEIAAAAPAHMADVAPPRPVARPALAGTEWWKPGSASRDAEPLARSAPILVALPAAQGEASRTLELVFGIPAQMYEDFLALRAAIEKEQQIDRVFGLLVPRFCAST